MGIQVTTLMWMRTTMNYQYRYGTTTSEALKALYKQGGIIRFYRGYLPALAQGPLSRFGDTAANAGMVAALDSTETTRKLPVFVKTMCASLAAASWRIFLMPIDAMKTTMQVEGKDGLKVLRNKIKVGGPTVVYHGALASFSATFVGHYPWFFTYNTLNAYLPQYEETHKKLIRNAVMGFTSSVVSDTCSNSIRVTKTVKQTSSVPLTYREAVMTVIDKVCPPPPRVPQTGLVYPSLAVLRFVMLSPSTPLCQDGVMGLFGRGLKTRILANGVQVTAELPPYQFLPCDGLLMHPHFVRRCCVVSIASPRSARRKTHSVPSFQITPPLMHCYFSPRIKQKRQSAPLALRT